MVVQAELGDGVAAIEASHAERDEMDFVMRKSLSNKIGQLLGALGNAGRGTEPRGGDTVAFLAEVFDDTAKVDNRFPASQPQRIKPKKAMDQYDRRTESWRSHAPFY